MNIKELRDIAESPGRPGLLELVVGAVKELGDSYKGAMILAGKLSVIAKMSTFDGHWNEKVRDGASKMEGVLLEIKKHRN